MAWTPALTIALGSLTNGSAQALAENPRDTRDVHAVRSQVSRIPENRPIDAVTQANAPASRQILPPVGSRLLARTAAHPTVRIARGEAPNWTATGTRSTSPQGVQPERGGRNGSKWIARSQSIPNRTFDAINAMATTMHISLRIVNRGGRIGGSLRRWGVGRDGEPGVAGGLEVLLGRLAVTTGLPRVVLSSLPPQFLSGETAL